MANELNGKTIAILAADGVEQPELEQPRDAIANAGGTTELLSLETGEIQAVNSDINPSVTFAVDKAVGDANLRMDADAIRFVQEFFKTGKPVGVICHGPWTLVEADLVRGRTLTSYPSVKTDIRNAGGNWVDEEVVVDQGLVSSRNPDDLPAFCAKIVEEYAEGAHDVAPEGATGR
jgi:protease I